MKLHIPSDLHREFDSIEIPQVAADLVILAGDTDTKSKGVAWATTTFPDQDVIYLAGNHEYYGERFPGLIEKLKERAAGSRVRVLENEIANYDEYRFFGCTLWSDLALFGDAVKGSIDALEMNDYKRIKHSRTFRKLRPADTRMHHQASLQHLEAFLAKGQAERSVVITHHAPSIQSLSEFRRTDPVSCAYASNLENLILRFQPLLWIHGHIHAPQRYRIGATTILANPHGYLDELEGKFDPALIVDLDELRQERATLDHRLPSPT